MKERCLCSGKEFYEDNLSIEICKGKAYIDWYACACGSFSRVYKINYCPICGRKLNKGDEEND